MINDAVGIQGLGQTDAEPRYLNLNPGQIIVSIAGQELTDEGNFVMGIFETEAIPIALSDSIYDSLTVSVNRRLYSLASDKNTVLTSRFYLTENSGGYGKVKLLSSQGAEIEEENLLTFRGN